MTVDEIMAQLESMGSESIRKIFLKHGVKEPVFGVKVEQLKTIQKKIKVDYQLAKDLYATGNADAMYLAGLIADDQKMTKADLQTWVKQAVSHNISGYTVPWVAAGSKWGFELALKWIDAPQEHVAAAGWATLGNLVSLKDDADLDLPALKSLLSRVVKTLPSAADRVRQTMNNFVVSVGVYVPALHGDAMDVAKTMGVVKMGSGETACTVRDAAEQIQKAKSKGIIGKKKKTVKC